MMPVLPRKLWTSPIVSLSLWPYQRSGAIENGLNAASALRFISIITCTSPRFAGIVSCSPDTDAAGASAGAGGSSARAASGHTRTIITSRFRTGASVFVTHPHRARVWRVFTRRMRTIVLIGLVFVVACKDKEPAKSAEPAAKPAPGPGSGSPAAPAPTAPPANADQHCADPCRFLASPAL